MSIRLRRREFIAGLGGAAAWPLAACTDRVRALQMRVLRLHAEVVADKIGAYIAAITSQIRSTVQLPWSGSTIEQRRLIALLLLRQVSAITELVQLDPTGKEQFQVGRLALQEPDRPSDYISHDPKFTEALARKVYYGSFYFRRESEPYMTLSVAGTGRDAGVSVAEVNLKFIWDMVSQTKVGQRGEVYVIDAEGRLIAHPDISLVLRNTDMTRLWQVAAARAAVSTAGPRPDSGVQDGQAAKNVRGREVLTAYAPVAPLGWLVFAEVPVDDADTLAR